jgi:hypothetical protein
VKVRTTLSNPSFIIQAVSGPGRAVFKSLADRGELAKDNFDIRLGVYAYSLGRILTSVHVTETISPSQAEQAMGYALRIFEVSDAKIKKIFSSKLEFPPTK